MTERSPVQNPTYEDRQLSTRQALAEFERLSQQSVAAMTEPQRVRQTLAYAAWLAYHGLEIDLATVLEAWE